MSRAQPTLDLPTVVLDFETYYDRDYSLRKMSIPAYVADPRFKVHGLAVERDGKAEFLPEPEVRTALSGLTGHAVICHNAMFDCLILKDHYDFVPKFIMDTLFMANHVLGPAKDSGIGNSLEKLADRLGIEAKGSLDFMEGVAVPDPEQQQRLADYAAADIRITRQVYQALLPQISRPEFELSQMLRHPRTRGTSTLTRLTGSLMPAQITSGGCSLALHGWQVCESPPSRIR